MQVEQCRDMASIFHRNVAIYALLLFYSEADCLLYKRLYGFTSAEEHSEPWFKILRAKLRI